MATREMTRFCQLAIALAAAAVLLVGIISPARSDERGSGATTQVILRPPLGQPPYGLVALLDTAEMNDASWKAAVSNPNVSGVALQIRWSDVELVQGSPDWSTLDALFAAAEKSKKWVHLLMFPGFWSPTWALKGAQTYTFAVQYGPGKGTLRSLPMPWDPVYLNNWFTFVQQVGARYSSSPALRLVGAAGPTSVSVESTLPISDLATWQMLGYTPAKYVDAWKQAFQAYAAAFPRQHISLSVGTEGVNIDDNGKISPGEGLRTREAIVDQGAKLLGSRFALQLSDVHAGPGKNGKTSEEDDLFVVGYIGKTLTGFQMGTNAANNSAFMGAAGDPRKALTKSMDIALQWNMYCRHVDYVEVHEQDILAPEMKPVLQSAASIFSHGPVIRNCLPAPATP